MKFVHSADQTQIKLSGLKTSRKIYGEKVLRWRLLMTKHYSPHCVLNSEWPTDYLKPDILKHC